MTDDTEQLDASFDHVSSAPPDPRGGAEAKSASPKRPARAMNHLSAKEWIKFTKSWFILSDGADKEKTAIHPGTFPLSLAKDFVAFFTKAGESVLDPFAGTGTTLIAADVLQRASVGIDIEQRFADFAAARTKSRYLVGDSHTLMDDKNHFADGCIDYIFTSPPYYNMLHRSRGGNKDTRHKTRKDAGEALIYTTHQDDLGNIHNLQEYIEKLVSLFASAHRLLAEKRYMTIIMQNMNADGRLLPIAWEFALAMTKTGLWDLKGEKIWCQENKKLGIYGFPTAYATNNFHHYCLTFRKL